MIDQKPNRASPGGSPGARSASALLRQKHAEQIGELTAICRVFQRVAERNAERFDGADRLAVTDAAKRLSEFFEATDERRKRP